jgi:hypothetical protein
MPLTSPEATATEEDYHRGLEVLSSRCICIPTAASACRIHAGTLISMVSVLTLAWHISRLPRHSTTPNANACHTDSNDSPFFHALIPVIHPVSESGFSLHLRISIQVIHVSDAPRISEWLLISGGNLPFHMISGCVPR